MKEKIPKELLDQLLSGYSKPEDLTGADGLLKRLTGALVARAIGAELTDHLGHEKGASGGQSRGNARNGTTPETLTTEQEGIPADMPRDRNEPFEPKVVK